MRRRSCSRLLVVTATAVLFGLGPSLQLARVPLSAALGQRGSVGSSRRNWTRSAMLVAEVGLSVVLLLGAGLLLRSLAALQQTNPGFDAAGLTVFSVSLPPARYPVEQVAAGHERLDAALAAMPGVTRVARISGLPLGPSENVRCFVRTDQPPPAPGQGPCALFRIADPDYLQTLKIPLLAGRRFEPTDRDGAPPVVVVSRRAADAFWPGEDPIGRSIRFTDGVVASVVGIVANVRSQTLAADAQPEMYVAHAQTALGGDGDLRDRERARCRAGPAGGAEAVRRLDARLPLIGPGAMTRSRRRAAGAAAFLSRVTRTLRGARHRARRGRRLRCRRLHRHRSGRVRSACEWRSARGAIKWSTMMLWQGLRPAPGRPRAGARGRAGAGRVIEGLLYEVRAARSVDVRRRRRARAGGHRRRLRDSGAPRQRSGAG